MLCIRMRDARSGCAADCSRFVYGASNRTKLLPYEYFSNWKLVQPWLDAVFRDLPGESRVRRGDFAMFVKTGAEVGPQVSADGWDHSVFPGDRIVMSMGTRTAMPNDCQRCGFGRTQSSVLRHWEW